MSEVTRLLEQAAADQEGALDEVFRRLHGELKILARSRLGRDRRNTLTPTGLVSELYLKFAGADQLDIKSQHHFFACAATAMRQIMVDAARAAHAGKRGGDAIFVTLTEPGLADHDTQIVALDDAMNELQQVDRELRELVELRFFAGLSMDQIAELKTRSVRSISRDWSRARAFLHAQLVL